MAKGSELEALGPCVNIDALEKYGNNLKKVIGFKKIALSKAVDGRLRISSSHGMNQFYQILEKGDTNGRYIPSGNKKLVKQLAQKSYDKRVISKMTKLECLIKSFCAQYKALVPDLVYENMADVRKAFVEPLILTDEQYAELWSSVEYYKKPFWVGDAEYYTGKGLRVRSKSEIIIADTLDRLGIPYRYEFPVELKKMGTVHPDFYVLRIKDRQEFCWEHFGMMDDPEYAERAIKKIAAYAHSGWIPGKNMIVTFESCSSPLSEQQVERIVEEIFGLWTRQGLEWLRSKTAERVGGGSRSHGKPGDSLLAAAGKRA